MYVSFCWEKRREDSSVIKSTLQKGIVTYSEVQHYRASPKFPMAFHNIKIHNYQSKSKVNNINRFTGHNLSTNVVIIAQVIGVASLRVSVKHTCHHTCYCHI